MTLSLTQCAFLVCLICAALVVHTVALRHTTFLAFAPYPHDASDLPHTAAPSTEPRYAAENVHVADPTALISSSDWSEDLGGGVSDDSDPSEYVLPTHAVFITSDGRVFATSAQDDPNGFTPHSAGPNPVPQPASTPSSTGTRTLSSSPSPAAAVQPSSSSSAALTNAFLARFGADLEQPEDEPLPEFRIWLHPKRRRDGAEFRHQIGPLVAHLTDLGLRKPRRLFDL